MNSEDVEYRRLPSFIIPNDYQVGATGTFIGIERDRYPEMKLSDLVYITHPLMRDPMDTPREIGFRADHR